MRRREQGIHERFLHIGLQLGKEKKNYKINLKLRKNFELQN